jgi:hypothetical protein
MKGESASADTKKWFKTAKRNLERDLLLAGLTDAHVEFEGARRVGILWDFEESPCSVCTSSGKT